MNSGEMDHRPRHSKAPQVLMVSKPVAPPWTDSSKNLVKDLACAGSRFSYRVLTPDGYRLPAHGVDSDPIYRDTGRYSPAVLQNLRVLARLLRQDHTALTHFFFAPNPRTSTAARLALRLRRRITIQTVCSTPAAFDEPERLLFARKVVVLSGHTRDRFLAAGVPRERLVRIPPGIQIPPQPTEGQRRRVRRRLGLPRDRPVVIYPGDLQFSRAAETFTLAAARLRGVTPAPMFVLACRPKQRESLDEAARIERILGDAGIRSSVRILGEVDDMLALLGACDLCVLVAESLYAKMDLPLVLLEAMALGVPLVVSDRPPLCELLQDEVGLSVPPADPEALAAAMTRLLGDRELLGRLGASAKNAAARRYGIEQVSSAYEDLYQSLLRESEQ